MIKNLFLNNVKYLNYTPLPYITKQFYSGICQIIMFHKVSEFDNNKSLSNGPSSLSITPSHLEMVIMYYKSNGYKFISMESLYEILKERKPEKKLVAITLDDGYKDNLTNAYPIFKKHNIPFTIYIPINLINQEVISYEYFLEDIILQRESIITSFGESEEILNITTMKQKNEAFVKLGLIFEQSVDKKNIIEFFKINNFKIDYHVPSIYLHWDEIIEMSKDKLCNFGSHTVNHFMLKKLDDAKMKYELAESKRILEDKLQTSVEHLAYPHGTRISVGEREFKMAKDLGYKTATTVRYADIFPEHIDSMHCLPRYNIKSVFSEPHLNLIMNGTMQMILNKFKRVVTE